MRILTEEEIEHIVADWVAGDFSVRAISVNRGHYEDTGVIIAQAQAAITREETIEETIKEVGKWLNGQCIAHHPGWYRCDCPTCVRTLTYALLRGEMPNGEMPK